MLNPSKLINRLTRHIFDSHYPQYPVYVFHHITKCGGTSLLNVLGKWFRTVPDYRGGWNRQEPCPVDLSRLRSIHYLCGHFARDGIYLYQRYPIVPGNSDFRLITFLRDPLRAKLSLYHFEKKRKGNNLSIEEHLFSRKNYLANRFPVTLENYRGVLDSYFFVRVIEEAQRCIDYLADELGKPIITIPILNRTSVNSSGIRPLLEERFREENKLDYLLYDYARELMKNRLAKAGQ